MNTERLLQLRRVLDEAPEERFHMRTWSEAADCGSAYCLAGFMAIDPWFRRETEVGNVFILNKHNCLLNVESTDIPFRFLAGVFAIAESDSENLFGYGIPLHADPHCVTRAEVRANIDRILAGRPAEIYTAISQSTDY